MSKIIESYKGEMGLSIRSALGAAPDLRAANNIFGSLGAGRFPFQTSMDFIPVNGNGMVIDVKGTNVDAQWLGLEHPTMQYWAYNYCSPLAAVIDRLAEADTNGELQYVNKDYTLNTTWKKNPSQKRVMELLLNPNPFQTWEEFNSEQVVICKIFGYCPVFCMAPAGMDKTYTKRMFNLNPYYARPVFNDQFSLFGNDMNTLEETLLGIDRENPIKEWNIGIAGRSYRINADQVLLIKDGFIDSNLSNLGLPISKIAGLDYFVSNICAAMEADNVL